MNDIGQKIKKLRKQKDISQETLSFELGVARQTVSKWEVGSMLPTTENIKALCEYFEVAPDYFLSNEYNTDLAIKKDTVVSNDNKENINTEVAATVETPKSKRKAGLIITSIIASIVVFIISLIVGIIAILVNLPSKKGFETVGRLEFDWSIIVCLVIALIALVTLIVLLIYRKKKKK